MNPFFHQLVHTIFFQEGLDGPFDSELLVYIPLKANCSNGVKAIG
jgi:hypothetical protein